MSEHIAHENEISWADFEKVLIVAGTVTRVEPFPEARKPAWKVWADFGLYGERKTSAQIAALYSPESLIGRQIVGVINFPEKQIGPFRSQFLLTGFHTEQGVVITAIERPVPNGARLA
jgi:tRNA-binding protein